jgi:LCP family protein required for cell wall assembly
VPHYKLSCTPVDYSGFNEFYDELVKCLENFDHRTDEEVLVDTALSRIEELIENNDFNSYLSDIGLSLSTRIREDLDYFYYDIYHLDGKKLGAFAVLKKLGEIYLVDADDIPVSSLKTLRVKDQLHNETKKKLIIPENIPRISDIYSDKDTITFLMIGTHERNTDTMILAHADKRSGEAYMIGIPRDLYWKNRKINSVYQYYGADELKKELSEITGLEISNYIVVDMYAFIDIINILGGIEVTLEEDLIDPTYRTRENGEWSTLNYKKGTYNLNGIEALRVARSRHGSNDFDRSKRQQLIIESFLEKFRQLKISDAGKVYSMIQALFEYVDTDFTVLDLISLYNNYGSSELAGSHVLSFDNILYDTYSNIYMLEEDDLNFDDDFNKGAWILLPEDNNWNNIRWYVRQIISGELN